MSAGRRRAVAPTAAAPRLGRTPRTTAEARSRSTPQEATPASFDEPARHDVEDETAAAAEPLGTSGHSPRASSGSRYISSPWAVTSTRLVLHLGEPARVERRAADRTEPRLFWKEPVRGGRRPRAGRRSASGRGRCRRARTGSRDLLQRNHGTSGLSARKRRTAPSKQRARNACHCEKPHPSRTAPRTETRSARRDRRRAGREGPRPAGALRSHGGTASEQRLRDAVELDGEPGHHSERSGTMRRLRPCRTSAATPT